MALDPEELASHAGKIMVLQKAISRDVGPVEEDGSDVLAQEHYLLALSALEQAERQMRIASYHQARANAHRG